MMDFDQLMASALELTPLERVRMMEKLAGSLEVHLKQNPIEDQQPRKSLYGLWKGVNISDEDIDEVRREMWKGFADEDEDLI